MDFSEGFQKGALQSVFVCKVDRASNAWDHPDIANLNKMIMMMVMNKIVTMLMMLH